MDKVAYYKRDKKNDRWVALVDGEIFCASKDLALLSEFCTSRDYAFKPLQTMDRLYAKLNAR